MLTVKKLGCKPRVDKLLDRPGLVSFDTLQDGLESSMRLRNARHTITSLGIFGTAFDVSMVGLPFAARAVPRLALKNSLCREIRTREAADGETALTRVCFRSSERPCSTALLVGAGDEVGEGPGWAGRVDGAGRFSGGGGISARMLRRFGEGPSSSKVLRFLDSFSSSSCANRRVGDEGEIGSEARGSLKMDCGESGCRLVEDGSRVPRILRLVGKSVRLDRGVKKRPKRRGVIEGFLFSFRELVLVGERRPLVVLLVGKEAMVAPLVDGVELGGPSSR